MHFKLNWAIRLYYNFIYSINPYIYINNIFIIRCAKNSMFYMIYKYVYIKLLILSRGKKRCAVTSNLTRQPMIYRVTCVGHK